MIQKSDDETPVRVLTEIRCMTVRGEPQTVVLQLSSGSHVAHYCLPIADLAALAERLRRDAMLLNG
jgi:hypothetical protein